VLRFAATPDQKCVLLDRVLLRALADDRVAVDSPERGIAVPALERSAVEDRLEARVIVEHQWIGTARSCAAATAATAVCALRCRWLRRNRCGEHDHERCDRALHTAPACCDTATVSQRPVFADFRTASVT